MGSKRMITWALAVPMVVICLMVLIVKLDTSEHYISHAMASKAMALALTDKAECIQSQRENGSSFLPEEQGQWYTKYMDYLAEEGYYEELPEDAEGPLTYGEAAYAAEHLEKGLSGALNISKKKYNKPMPKEEWWFFYESFVEAAGASDLVEQKQLLLYGTPANVNNAAAWTAYTSEGVFGFDGLALDAYLDHEISVLSRGGEIIHFVEEISDKVTYENVWVIPAEEEGCQMYIGSIVRELPEISKVREENGGVLADIVMQQGKVKKVSLKSDTIEGTVLAVQDNTIEIEGYGKLKLDDEFRVYKTYGMISEQKKESLLVGYDSGKFVVTGKKVCAALMTKDFSAKNIRVLLMDDSYSSIFHSEVVLTSDGVMKITYNDTEQLLESGTEIRLLPGDERLKSGRISVETADPQKQISVMSIERQQGVPSYFGSIEVSEEAEGLILLNSVDIEDYLTRVVPSEMPASYELEALKAQAVCARTYAIRQIRSNAYSKYGAHVDDSTSYQVYNNIVSSEKTDLAVKETGGLVVYYGDEPAETYYYSTSCGHSTDGTIWGSSLDAVPYLKGISLSSGETDTSLSSDEVFVPFIKGQGFPNYDSGYGMYRWKTTVTNRQLEAKYPELGEVQGIFVTERGTGGIALTLKIVGSEGEKTIKGELQIRNALGSTELTYKKNDGTTVTDWKSLPSAYIAVDETARDKEKGLRTFTIWGGGYGHGVGMSQNGAQQMAKEGKSFEEILKFFYHGVEVKELLH